MREAPESVKYHGGFDPADPARRGSCSECGWPDDECECHPDDCDCGDCAAVKARACLKRYPKR